MSLKRYSEQQGRHRPDATECSGSKKGWESKRIILTLEVTTCKK